MLATAAVSAPATLRAWLPEFTAVNLARAPEDVLDLLWRLCRQEASPADRDQLRRPALVAAARAACRALPAVVGSEEPAADPFGPVARWNYDRPLSAQAIRSLLALIWYCAPAVEADEVAALLVQRPAAAPPDRALPQALAELRDFAVRPVTRPSPPGS